MQHFDALRVLVFTLRLKIVVFALRLLYGKRREILAAQLVAQAFFIGIGVANCDNLVVKTRHCGIFPEVCAVCAIAVMPRFGRHDIVENRHFLFLNGYSAENFGVPFAV